MDVDIVTINEEHGGQFSDTHARYVLQAPIVFATTCEAGEVAA